MASNKNELTRLCYESSGSVVGQSMIELLSFLQDEARRKNDEAEGNEVYRNQGEVRAYKSLLSMFTKKPPEILKK